MKCRRFYFFKDGRIAYMAKQKDDEIYIGEGNNCHIRASKENSNLSNRATIIRDRQGYNIVNTEDQEFKVKYLSFGNKKYSMSVIFTHKGKQLNWRPKNPPNHSSIKGEYNHAPMASKKNIILQNLMGRSTLIVRKMSKKSYEIECHPIVSPIVIFSLAISQIVRPLCY